MPFNNANWNQGFQVLDANGDAIDITGFDIRITVRREASDSASLIAATTSNYITLTVPTEGKFEIDVPKSVMETLPVGSFPYDVVRVNGSEWTRYWGGMLNVWQGVTR